jgi:lipid A biosynthesis lauroyl (or palmitoleoyl) acyltransferase
MGKMKFTHPRYWPIWILFGLLRVLNFLPYRIQVRLGRVIGRLVMLLSPMRRRIARINLRLCFPDWTEEKRRVVLWQHAESLGISLFEFGISWWWSDARFRPLAHIEGLENLRDALQKNKGVILLAGHFTTLEIISRVLKLHADFHPMYRKNNHPLIDHMITSGRIRHTGKVIPHDDLRSMIRSLRGNMPVLYIPDQNFGRRHSIFVPFFGIQTATVPATSRLASMDNIPVVPIIQQRLPDDQGYRLVIEKALEDFPGEDLAQDTIRINQLFEEQVRDNPADYLWVHRRFKTRPEGEAPIY